MGMGQVMGALLGAGCVGELELQVMVLDREAWVPLPW